MNHRPPPREPTLTPKAQAEQEARRAREAAALRANLLRRKQQARTRTDAEAVAAQPGGDTGADRDADR